MSAPALPSRRLLGLIIVTQMAFGLLAMTLCLPSMNDWRTGFGASQAQVQLTFSAYALSFGAMQLLYGPLSDRLGRRPVVLAGLAVAVVASMLAALAPSLGLLVLARLLQGAGSAAGMVVGRALVQDHYQASERTRMMAFVGMTMGLCPPTATLLGGQIHVHLGWRWSFVFVALLGLVLLVAAARVLPAPAQHAPRADGPAAAGWSALWRGYGQILQVRDYRWFVAILCTTTASFYAFLAGAPIVLANFGVTPDRLGLYIMVPPLAYIVGNFTTSRIARRLGDVTMMRLGQAVTVGGLVLTLGLAVAGVRGPLALALPLMLLGFGHGLLVPPTLSGTVGLLPAVAGSAAALAGVMQQVGGALGGYTVGLVTQDGAANLAALMLGWSLLGLAAQLMLHRRRAMPGVGTTGG